MAVDGVHQSSDVVRRRRRDDPMAKVEDMSRRGTGGTNDCIRCLPNRFRIGQQGYGIEVALHRYAIADLTSGRADIHGPVHTDTLRTALGEVIEPGAAAFGEEDCRDTSAKRRAREPLQYRL